MSDPPSTEPEPEPGPGPRPGPEFDPRTTASDDPADRLAGLWRRGQRPDLAGFLAQAGPLAPLELAAVLRVDQARRWEAGERVPAESYLADHPTLQEEPEAALDLIYAEYLLLERLGERPDLEAFLARFPGHRDTLKPQVELHLALERATDGDPSEVTRAGSLAADTLRPWLGGSFNTDPPREIGRYRIEALLGQGGMGRVYRALDTKLGRPVALKIPHVGRGGSDIPLQRFYREARVASTFNHPNLCPVFDLGEHEGVHYLTMPLLAGETLAARLSREGPLPEAEAAALAARIARAMQVAHDAGILHRDLKPANVMLDPAGEPIVMDFGLARRLQIDDVYNSAPGVLVGTLAYVSPEQIGGDPRALGPSCDVYSLGVMLSEMLTGRVPFHGPSHAMLAQILARNADRPSKHRPGLDRRLERITLRAMAEPGESSFASMADFAQALDDWQTGEPPRAPLSRRLWAYSAAGVLAAALTGALAWTALSPRTLAPQQPQPQPPPPQQQPGALLTPGSRWAGRFRFRPPITDYTGDVEIIIHERRGESFRGLYSTEHGAYQWKFAGTLHGDAIRWDFVEAVRDNSEHNVVGKAYVEGRIHGPDLHVAFLHPGSGDADMELHRTP